jgi:hypothetical protein
LRDDRPLFPTPSIIPESLRAARERFEHFAEVFGRGHADARTCGFYLSPFKNKSDAKLKEFLLTGRFRFRL